MNIFLLLCSRIEKVIMKKIWIQEESPKNTHIQKLAEELRCPKLIAQLLIQRNISTVEEANAFFSPSLNMLHDPFLMKDMDKAVLRLDKAIASDEGILIFGDYDVDGTTSVSLIYKYLSKVCEKSNLKYYIPSRYGEGYGISYNAIDYAKEQGLTLMIITDCGIKDVENIAYAKSKGIDVIICDHHTPGDEIPDAIAVLDPQRKDCNYPYKWLSGCGVSFKLIQAHCRMHNKPVSNLYKLLDLVAVSIASDIVPLTGENRILAYWGLKQLNENPSLGLKTIINNIKTYYPLTINDIIFKIGPKINAAGRMGTGVTSVDLLIAEDSTKAKQIFLNIDDFNIQRKKLDHKITQQAIDYIKNDEVEQSKKTTVLYNKDWHKGVLGIVASRLTEYIYRPAIILTESNGDITGSARSIEDFDLYSAIAQCSDLLINYGGHKSAAGLTLSPQNLDIFKERFETIVCSMMANQQQTPQININAAIKLSDITQDLFNWIQKFAPFGPLNPIPTFVSNDVMNFIGSGKVGKNREHLKLVVVEDTRNLRPQSGIGFNMGSKYDIIKHEQHFNICYTLQANRYMGKNEIQMIIQDVQTNY